VLSFASLSLWWIKLITSLGVKVFDAGGRCRQEHLNNKGKEKHGLVKILEIEAENVKPSFLISDGTKDELNENS